MQHFKKYFKWDDELSTLKLLQNNIVLKYNEKIKKDRIEEYDVEEVDIGFIYKYQWIFGIGDYNLHERRENVVEWTEDYKYIENLFINYQEYFGLFDSWDDEIHDFFAGYISMDAVPLRTISLKEASLSPSIFNALKNNKYLVSFEAKYDIWGSSDFTEYREGEDDEGKEDNKNNEDELAQRLEDDKESENEDNKDGDYFIGPPFNLDFPEFYECIEKNNTLQNLIFSKVVFNVSKFVDALYLNNNLSYVSIVYGSPSDNIVDELKKYSDKFTFNGFTEQTTGCGVQIKQKCYTFTKTNGKTCLVIKFEEKI